MTRRLQRHISSAITIAVLLTLALVPATATAGMRHCPTFSVPRTYSATEEVTFTFYKVHARDVSCRRTRELITLYLFGKGHRAGPSPTEGSMIQGWNVLVITTMASGRKGRQSFWAMYR